MTESQQGPEEQLKVQLEFLNSSSRAYDEGDSSEAIRLAVTVRVLCHSTNSSHALLDQLGILDTLMFVDTCHVTDETPAIEDSAEDLRWVASISALRPSLEDRTDLTPSWTEPLSDL